MFPFLRLLCALALLWLAAGCEVDRVLTIKSDGSGQIHERFLAPKDTFVKPGTAGLSRPTVEFVGKNAAEFGQGVEVVSFKKIETEEMLGYEAVYEFADVNMVRADKFLNRGDSDVPDEKDPKDPPQNFQFVKGAVNELSLPLEAAQKPKEGASPSPEQAKEDPQQRAAFIEALKHLNVRIAIRVEGKIEETNSHFRQDNEVVVWEMNLKGHAADPKHAEEWKDAAAGKTAATEPPADDRYIKHEDLAVLKIRFR
jgi:hypothetical protein